MQNFLLLLSCLYMSTSAYAYSPRWMDEVNISNSMSLTQGERAFLIIADLGPVAKIEKGFQNRVLYFKLPGSLEPFMQRNPNTHATGVAFIAAATCCDFTVDKRKHMACGVAQKAKIISLDNAIVASQDRNPGSMVSTILKSLGIDIGSIPTYDADNKKVSLLPNVVNTNIINLSIGELDRGLINFFLNWFGFSSFVLEKNVEWPNVIEDNLLVIAAGNDAEELTEEKVAEMFPLLLTKKIMDSVIIVAGISDNGKFELSDTSNFGALVDIGAPGKNLPIAEGVDKFKMVGGTTYATAIVSGAAALLLSCNNQLTGKEIKKILLETADTKASLSEKIRDSKFLNIGRAVERVCEEDPAKYSEKPRGEIVKNQKSNLRDDEL